MIPEIITDNSLIEPSVNYHRRFVRRTVCDRLARKMPCADRPNTDGSILTVCDEASTITYFVVVNPRQYILFRTCDVVSLNEQMDD